MTAGVALRASSAADDDLALDVVGLEHVAADHHELAPLGDGQRPDGADGLEPGRGEPGLRLGAEEVAGHAELPIGTVEEPGHAPDSTEGV